MFVVILIVCPDTVTDVTFAPRTYIDEVDIVVGKTKAGGNWICISSNWELFWHVKTNCATVSQVVGVTVSFGVVSAALTNCGNGAKKPKAIAKAIKAIDSFFIQRSFLLR